MMSLPYHVGGLLEHPAHSVSRQGAGNAAVKAVEKGPCGIWLSAWVEFTDVFSHMVSAFVADRHDPGLSALARDGDVGGA